MTLTTTATAIVSQRERSIHLERENCFFFVVVHHRTPAGNEFKRLLQCHCHPISQRRHVRTMKTACSDIVISPDVFFILKGSIHATAVFQEFKFYPFQNVHIGWLRVYSSIRRRPDASPRAATDLWLCDAAAGWNWSCSGRGRQERKVCKSMI